MLATKRRPQSNLEDRAAIVVDLLARFPLPGEAEVSGFARPREIAVLAPPDPAALPA